MLRTYSTVGTRGDVEFMLWGASERLEDHHELAATSRRHASGRTWISRIPISQ